METIISVFLSTRIGSSHIQELVGFCGIVTTFVGNSVCENFFKLILISTQISFTFALCNTFVQICMNVQNGKVVAK